MCFSDILVLPSNRYNLPANYIEFVEMVYFIIDICLISLAALKICHRKLFICLPFVLFFSVAFSFHFTSALSFSHMFYLHGIFEPWCIRYKNDLKLPATEIKYLMYIRIWFSLVVVNLYIYSPPSQWDACVSGVWVLFEHAINIISGTCVTDCFQKEQNIRQHHYVW